MDAGTEDKERRNSERRDGERQDGERQDGDGWELSLLDGATGAPGAALPGRSGQRAVGVVAALVVGAAALGVLAFLRPTPVPPLTSAPVVAVSITARPPSPPVSAVAQIVGTYRIGAPAAGTPPGRYLLDGVVGPAIGTGASVQSVVTQQTVDGAVVTVTVTPDCAGLAPGAPPGPSPPDPSAAGPSATGPSATGSGYLLAMTREGPDGRRAHGRIPAPGPSADWGSAVRRVCWQWLAGQGLRVVAVRPVALAGPRTVVGLEVSLRSTLAQDVELRVVDIADVATVDAADAGVLPAGSTRAFRVRLPVGDCAAPGLPALQWSVGPVGADPVTVLSTPLDPAPRAGVDAALRRACEPPDTSVTVSAARVLAPRPDVGDRAGVSIGVDLAVDTGAEQLLLGSDTSVLTADARVTFTPAQVLPVRRRATARVVWHVRCPSPDPPVLPVWVVRGQSREQYAVRLDDPALSRARSTACLSTPNAAPNSAPNPVPNSAP